MLTLPNNADAQAREILEHVVASLERIDIEGGLSAYVFGSVLKKGSGWSDVDVLLVTENFAESDRLRLEMEPIAAIYPLHLTILLQSEFEELCSNAWGQIYALIGG